MKYKINDYTTTELCPHCGAEVEILRKGVSACPECGEAVLPCSECENCDYNNCPYGSLHHDATKDDINVCSADILSSAFEWLNRNIMPEFYIVEGEIAPCCNFHDDEYHRHILVDKTEKGFRIMLECAFYEEEFNGFTSLIAEKTVSIGELPYVLHDFLKLSTNTPLIGPRYIVEEAPDTSNYRYAIFDRVTCKVAVDGKGDPCFSDNLTCLQVVIESFSKELVVLERKSFNHKTWYGGYEKDENGEFVQLFNTSAACLFMDLEDYARKGYKITFLNSENEAEFMKDRTTIEEHFGSGKE